MQPLWISQQELMARPTSGSAWNATLSAAKTSKTGGANLADMNSSHDLGCVAIALAGVRLNDAALLKKGKDALTLAIGTEKSIRWLEIGRNLGGYIVAADVLDIRSGPVFDWLASFMTKPRPHNNTGRLETIQQNAWSSGSNASAQMGFVHAALAVYLQDLVALEWSWMAFRRYCGDRTSTWKMASNNDAWQAIPNDVVGVQNAGAKSANDINIDGAVSNDMMRSNPKPVASLVWVTYSNYPWVGMNGAVLAAEVFYRQGYPAYEIVDRAILRAATYLKNLGGKWYDTGTRKDIKHLINKRYAVNYPLSLPVGKNGLVGFTDFVMG